MNSILFAEAILFNDEITFPTVMHVTSGTLEGAVSLALSTWRHSRRRKTRKCFLFLSVSPWTERKITIISGHRHHRGSDLFWHGVTMFGKSSGYEYQCLSQRDSVYSDTPGLFSSHAALTHSNYDQRGLSFDYVPKVSQNDFTGIHYTVTHFTEHILNK